MANQQMTRRVTQRPQQMGVRPTPSEKLIYVANKLGLPGIAGMQGSSFNLVDTVNIATNAGRQTLTFFTQTANKSRNFTNFQNGQLNAGEALLIERINFFILTLSATNLTSDASQILDIVPISELTVASGQFGAPGAFKTALMTLSIANQTVIKDYSVFEQEPDFNPQTTGISIAAFDTTAASTGQTIIGPVGYNGIPTEASPVLPPNQKFSVQLELPPIGVAAVNVAVMCVVGRFGSIFASKTTL